MHSQARHPALQVQFVLSDTYIDLAQGDADVTMRSGDPDDELRHPARVGFDDSMAKNCIARWLQAKTLSPVFAR